MAIIKGGHRSCLSWDCQSTADKSQHRKDYTRDKGTNEIAFRRPRLGILIYEAFNYTVKSSHEAFVAHVASISVLD